ncbi:MAG: YicC/YloC family endoribonuclease [Bacteroidota bacterium]
MIKSMTGYGKSTIGITSRNLTIEIKTLNSKQLDLNLKIPGYLKEKEFEIRTLITQKLERGKIEFYIATEVTGESSSFVINHALAKKYYQEIKSLADELGIETTPDLLSILIKMPDVMETSRDEFSENDWSGIAGCIKEAIMQADNFRIDEGKILEADMLMRVQSILQLLESIDPHEKRRVVAIRERIVRDFAKYSEDTANPPVDQNRFEQELIYYFEKLDVTEEKVRLLKHCEYFIETLHEAGSQGKKLGFVTQELGREINTIGSKANDAQIQRIVVQMKDELEKIKEQLGNIL